MLGVGTDDKAFNLSSWEFSEDYYMDAFDFESEQSLPLLCAHIYWRSLVLTPSLARIWFSENKNRKLTLAVEDYTRRYFSPILIKKEFKSLEVQKEPISIVTNLQTNEVTCLYTIEDAVLDMNIKIPGCFPLRLVDVNSGSGGGKSAGLPESRWRSWLLSVSSVLSAQNGSLQDAIEVFKKNVELHFEGIEDCSICYSVIGVIDRQLPTKSCRVCKHKFHGSCLYKWVFYILIF
jgi:hypothetical protein